MISVKIIADSVSEASRITTLQLVYPRFIHAEFMTHRVFSRNASSSRAIPVKKMIQMVRDEPAMPIHWGKNQPGMQAGEELTGKSLDHAKSIWLRAARNAANLAEEMEQIGLHKQVANRILEPFQHMHVLVTASEWDNFFELRLHKDAQPEIQLLALQMFTAMSKSKAKPLQYGEWHLPYVTEEDFIAIERLLGNPMAFDEPPVIDLAKKISAARCCRVSYLKHDGTNPSIEEDLKLCERLAGSRPIHASPFEHQATPDLYSEGNPPDMVGGAWSNPHLHGNFVGWIQYRKQIEQSFK